MRAERVAVARRLLAAGRLCQLRTAGLEAHERAQWCIDNWEAVAAEVGAELGISRGRASSQMHYGVELLERLPQLGAVFAAGEVDFRVVAVAFFRTGLITDPEVLTSIDTQLARCAPGWNALSQKKLVEYIDWRVRALDPAAERVDRGRDGDRHMEIEPDGGGLAELRGCLRAPDAAALDRRLDQLAASVCREDSRTARQRRVDAVAALVAGASAMACDCGLQNCPGGPGNATGNGQIVIQVVAEAASVSGAGDRPGYLPGYGAIPPEAAPPAVPTYAVGQPDSGSRPDADSRRSLMMPTRRRSRAADRAARVKFERGLNEARWAADPPPF